LKYQEYNDGDSSLSFTVAEPNGFDPENEYPIIVLMHGFGASSKDLAPLASAIDARRFVYAFPQAPIEMKMGLGGFGYAWAPISGDAMHESIKNSKKMINTFLDEILKLYSSKENKIVLGGFSQGAMMALEVGLYRSDIICGIVSCSGWLNNSQLDRDALPSHQNQSIFICHGTLDDVVPIQKSIEALDTLKSFGYSPEFQEYDIAHEISHIEISDISHWLKSNMPATANN